MNAWIPEVSKRQMEIYNTAKSLVLDWGRRSSGKTIRVRMRPKPAPTFIVDEYVKEN